MKDFKEDQDKHKALPFEGLSAELRNPQKARLRSELVHLKAMLQECEGNCDPRNRAALERAGKHLEYVEQHWRRDPNSGWQHAFFALEQIVRHYPDDRLIFWAQTLRAELCEAGRFTYWRRMAIEDLLERIPRASTQRLTPRQREAYFEALRLRDQALINQYWRLNMVRHHQLLLAAIGAPVLIATSVIIAIYARELTTPNQDQAVWKGGPVPCLLAILIGILGAIVSAAQRTTKTPPQRIPEILGSDIASFSRIPIGAVAGLTVWLFSVASVHSAIGLDVPNLLLAAFGAGFAERLIVQGSGAPVLGSGQAEGVGPLSPRPKTLDGEALGDKTLEKGRAPSSGSSVDVSSSEPRRATST